MFNTTLALEDVELILCTLWKAKNLNSYLANWFFQKDCFNETFIKYKSLHGRLHFLKRSNEAICISFYYIFCIKIYLWLKGIVIILSVYYILWIL